MFCGRDIEDGRAERDEEMVVGNKVRQEQEDSKVQANGDKEKNFQQLLLAFVPTVPACFAAPALFPFSFWMLRGGAHSTRLFIY